MKTVGGYLRRLRESKNLTQTEAARLLGWPAQKLCNLENNHKNAKKLDLEVVSAFADIYGVPVGEIASHTIRPTHRERTATELIGEMLSGSRMAEMICEKLLKELETYPQDLEAIAIELSKRIQTVSSLIEILHRSHLTVSKKTKGKASKSKPKIRNIIYVD